MYKRQLTACARNAGNLKSYAEFAGVVGILLFRAGLVQPNTEIVCFDTQLLFLANITDELDDLVVLVPVRSDWKLRLIAGSQRSGGFVGSVMLLCGLSIGVLVDGLDVYKRQVPFPARVR